MKNSFYVISFLMLYMSTTVFAQEFHHLKANAKLSGQQMYVLPKATFEIEVQVVKITYKRGEKFQEYSEDQQEVLRDKYGLDLKIYKKIKASNEVVTVSVLADSLKVSTIPSPDYSKVFYVNPETAWNKNQSVTFSYGNDGILSEGDASREDITFDLVVKGLSGLVSVAKAAALLEAGATDIVLKPLDDARADFKNLALQSDYQIYKDLKTTYEKKYAQLFGQLFYTVEKSTSTVKFFYTPDTIVSSPLPFFQVDDKGKLVVNETLQDKVWGKKIDFGKMDGSAFSLTCNKFGEQAVDYYTERKDELHKGFAFNVPAKAVLELQDKDKKTVFKDVYKIPQFGVVGFIQSWKQKLTFSLDPITGELKKLTMSGKAVTADQIGAATTLATDATTLIKGDDYATKLQKEVTILENEKKKRDLLSELGIE